MDLATVNVQMSRMVTCNTSLYASINTRRLHQLFPFHVVGLPLTSNLHLSALETHHPSVCGHCHLGNINLLLLICTE
jgi:hypothetical protein